MTTETLLPDFTLKAGLDRSLAWRRGGSVRYIVAELAAHLPILAVRPEPKPLNLALVIDASGSMSGPKLENAKKAATGIVAALGPKDRISIISFDDEVTVHVDGVSCVDGERHRILQSIARIVTSGTTNLSDGWFSGAEAVARGMDGNEGALNRVVLLSDGKANRGITHPAELAEHARALAQRQVFTSTVGIGDDYHSPVLRAIAENGGGRMHDAETPEEIIEVLLGELKETRQLAAEAVTLTVQAPATVQAAVVGSFPITVTGALSVFVGSIVDGTPVRVVIRLTLPEGANGEEILFSLSARGKVPGSGEELATGDAEVVVRLAPGELNSGQHRDVERSQVVARTWHAMIAKTAANMNRDGERRQAKHYLERELRWFERYCDGLAGTTTLVRDVAMLLRRCGDNWNERVRKDMEFASYSLMASKFDHRAGPREAWAERLRDDK